ncbi:hypothetical protein FRC03_005380 [Tulasnella sp. 419]|nr:hypothetical protein FRC03_005380 [Tulasnella sp. 419]
MGRVRRLVFRLARAAASKYGHECRTTEPRVETGIRRKGLAALNHQLKLRMNLAQTNQAAFDDRCSSSSLRQGAICTSTFVQLASGTFPSNLHAEIIRGLVLLLL